MQSCIYLIFVVRCAIWYHSYNKKNVKNTHGGVLLLEVTLLHGFFSRFLNCTYGTKLRNAPYLSSILLLISEGLKVQSKKILINE